MFTEIFRENASFEEKIREIKQVLTLLQNNVISEQCEIPSAPKYWCYVLLPGRIGLEQWGALIAAGYRCLTHPDGYQFAIVLSAEELFSEVIIDTLSIQNDFYYLTAFASSPPSDDGKLLKWIDALLNNEIDDEVPPCDIFTFNCGVLIR